VSAGGRVGDRVEFPREMAEIATQLIIIFFLILANGLFSMAEMAVVSARKTRLLERAERGDRRARVALDLIADPNRLLSTVQVGITLVATFAGVFGGVTIAEELADWLAAFPVVGPYAKPVSLAVVVGGLTFVTLVLGELVPKRIALSRPEAIARLVAVPLRWISAVGVPAVRLLGASTDAVLFLLRVGPPPDPGVTEEEVNVMLKEGTRSGVFELVEQEMVRRVLRLGDRRASRLMTPRTEVVWIDVSDPPEEIRRKVTESPHSRFPVCDGTLDNVLGIVEAKDLLAHGLTHQPFQLKGLLRVPLFIYEGTLGLKVLETFRLSGTHVAVVISEYGSVEGLLTPNDLLEAIVGDLPEGDTPGDQRVVRRPDGSWLLDGMLGTDEFKDLFPRFTPPEGDYGTLAGLVLAGLERIPSVSDTFDWDGLRFEVVDMDGNRIDRVLVAPVPRA